MKFLSECDSTIKEHLEKATAQHQQLATKRSEKSGLIGRGSRLTVISNDSQNKLILVIGTEISTEVTSLQSMADLDTILGAPTVSYLRCGCARTVQNS